MRQKITINCFVNKIKIATFQILESKKVLNIAIKFCQLSDKKFYSFQMCSFKNGITFFSEKKISYYCDSRYLDVLIKIVKHGETSEKRGFDEPKSDKKNNICVYSKIPQKQFDSPDSDPIGMIDSEKIIKAKFPDSLLEIGENSDKKKNIFFSSQNSFKSNDNLSNQSFDTFSFGKTMDFNVKNNMVKTKSTDLTSKKLFQTNKSVCGFKNVNKKGKNFVEDLTNIELNSIRVKKLVEDGYIRNILQENENKFGKTLTILQLKPHTNLFVVPIGGELRLYYMKPVKFLKNIDKENNK